MGVLRRHHRGNPDRVSAQLQRHLMCSLRCISRGANDRDSPGFGVDAQDLLANLAVVQWSEIEMQGNLISVTNRNKGQVNRLE